MYREKSAELLIRLPKIDVSWLQNVLIETLVLQSQFLKVKENGSKFMSFDPEF
jgi:hypothetical protein